MNSLKIIYYIKTMKYDEWDKYFKEDTDLLNNTERDKIDVNAYITKFEEKIKEFSLEQFKII